MRLFRESIISNFIFEFIEHKCDENEKHFISLNLMCEKLQRTISFASRFRFNSFLQRWKTLVKLHNLTYFDFYHMLRCMKITTATFEIENDFDCRLDCSKNLSFWKLEFMIDENELLNNASSESFSWTLSSFRNLDLFQTLETSYFNNYINIISISIIFTTLKCVYIISLWV